MTQKQKMTDRCIARARAAVSQAKIKGLAPHDVGVALIAEALAFMHGIDIGQAYKIIPHLNAYANEILQSEIIEKFKCDGGAELEVDWLRKHCAENQSKLDTPVIRDLADQASARAVLMGATALPPNDWAPGRRR